MSLPDSLFSNDLKTLVGKITLNKFMCGLPTQIVVTFLIVGQKNKAYTGTYTDIDLKLTRSLFYQVFAHLCGHSPGPVKTRRDGEIYKSKLKRYFSRTGPKAMPEAVGKIEYTCNIF